MLKKWQTSPGHTAWQQPTTPRELKSALRGQRPWRRVAWVRVWDFLSGVGLGLFVGAVAALLLLGQLGQGG